MPSQYHKVPGSSVRLLSEPSKMPCYSWSLPAHKACPRENGTICQDCYASKGFYVWPVVINAQQIRHKWTLDCIKSKNGHNMGEFVSVMLIAIRHATRTNKYFRVHDSGDFFSAEYAACWLALMMALPEVKFWATTRMWQQPVKDDVGFRVLNETDKILCVVMAMAKLPNVTIRPSALNFGEPAPVVYRLNAGAAVDYVSDSGTHYECPAHYHGNKCMDCRFCWNDKNHPVSYHQH